MIVADGLESGNINSISFWEVGVLRRWGFHAVLS